jgi:hypothetical protein
MPRRQAITFAFLLSALLVAALPRTAAAAPAIGTSPASSTPPAPRAATIGPGASAESTRDACTLAGLVPAPGSHCPAGDRLRPQWGIPSIPDPIPIVKKVVGGGVANAIKSAALGAILGWVASGAESALKETAKVIDDTTSPQLTSSWFSSSYWRVAGIAALLTVPFLCAAMIHAVVRSDLGLLTRAAFGYLPLSLLAVGIASQLTMLLLAGTDEMSSIVASASLHADGVFLSSTSVRAVAESVATGDPFVTFLAAIITVAATLTLWLELLVRNAAVYVIVLMLPLFFAAMVWPARRTLAIRAIETLIALILSKFAIVAVLSLGGSALGHSTIPGAASVLTGGTLVLLAAFTPWALLRMLPLHEVASAAAGGLSHSPKQALSSATSGAMGLADSSAALGAELLRRTGGPDGEPRTPRTRSGTGQRSVAGTGAELDAGHSWADPRTGVEAEDVAEPVVDAMSGTDGAGNQLGPETATVPGAATGVTPVPEMTVGATGGDSTGSATDQPDANAGSRPRWRKELALPGDSEGGGSELSLGPDMERLAAERGLPPAGAGGDGEDAASTRAMAAPPPALEPPMLPTPEAIGPRTPGGQDSGADSEADEPPTATGPAPELGFDPRGGDA